MAWHRTGDKPLYEPMMAKFTDACLYKSASMSYCKKLRCSICMWRQSDVIEAIPRKLHGFSHNIGIGWLIFIRIHDDVIKWKHFPRYWPFARGIHRSPVNSPHKGQWRGALVFFNLRLSKQSWGWWFEAPSCSLWRHSVAGLALGKLHDCHETIYVIDNPETDVILD